MARFRIRIFDQALVFAAAFGILVFILGGGAIAQDLHSLLRSPAARLETGLIKGSNLDQIDGLLDDDVSTLARLEVEGGIALDLLFEFGEEGVGPQEITLTIPEGSTDARPVSFDLLVSSVSPTTGFRSIKSERLDSLKPSQTFQFRPVAARWLMIRLFPAPEAGEMLFADIVVTGTLGPPETVYAFGETPANALDVIEGLSILGDTSFGLTDQERTIFSRVSGGELNQRDFEEIVLFASGVRDAVTRADHVAQIDRLEASLRTQINIDAQPLDVGQALLTWLHGNVLTDGYVEGQTDLSVVLSDAKFNCVSSAVIYNILGQRIGLDMRAIEVPDHAFSILYNGTDHADVETTTSQGFNPRRDRVTDFENLTGFQYIPESNRSQRREIGRAGLAALIYYNHGVEFYRKGMYHEALLANFRAMSLDPESSSAATNALAAMGKWSRELSDGQNWEEAVLVAALGRRLAPQDNSFANNQIAIWQNWALSVASGGDFDAALTLLSRGATEVPEADFNPVRSALFIRPAEAELEAGQWAAALRLANLGLKSLKGASRDDVDDWRENFFLRQANLAIQAADYPVAADVLAEGLKLYPDSRGIAQNVRYLAQEWANVARDFDAGLKVLADILEHFQTVENLNDIVEAYVTRQIHAASDSGVTILATLDMAKRAAPLLGTAGVETPMAPLIYQTYGNTEIDQKNWAEAAEIYSAGLNAFPDNWSLSKNAHYIAQEWQRSALEEGGTEGLAAVTQELRSLFPMFAVGTEFGETEIRRKVQTLAENNDYDGAMDFLNGAQLLLTSESYLDLRLHIFNHQADQAMQENRWEDAARVYAQGRDQIGDNGLFSNNVAYITQEWTQAAAQASGAAGVAGTLAILTEVFPGDAEVAEMGKRTLTRLVSDLAQSDQFEQAKSQILLARSFLNNDEVRSLTVVLYLDNGNSKLEDRDWRGALLAYSDGLEVVPDSSDLQRNVPYAFQEWSRDALNEGGGQALLEAISEMNTVFPNSALLDDILKSVLSKFAENRVLEGNQQSALVTIEEVAPVLSQDTVHDVKVSVYESWARLHFKHGGWARAVEIYQIGLDDLGGSSLLENNLSYAQSKLN